MGVEPRDEVIAGRAAEAGFCAGVGRVDVDADSVGAQRTDDADGVGLVEQ
ncbi:hypothetical protein [Amycolatopsis acidicola]